VITADAGSLDIVAIPRAECEWLHALYLEALKVRDKGIQQFNRLSPEMRLATTSLAAHYREQGYDERGLPKAEHVAALFEIGGRK
jgi:hypothetical protein